jgi:predicted nucleotidyltransferase
MVDSAIVKTIQNYLNYVRKQGIPVSYGVLFGSYVKNTAHKWSDIDLLVVSPRFDEVRSSDDYENLWMYAARTDRRIEPIPVGEKQFKTDKTSMIVVIARREGQIIPLAE